ncbi:LOW QUALITY PROTEIN: probable ATP-dependent RNA helicase DDX20 [Drosophila obscura]|uniref:LOW QUALITY PROTEIN: probable ATP-dependent RNA helicase DDX20 n=1 Tax=Drosophila obscura TaxID=7282 RepID=UPI001BB11BF5|nr:LOW QUALITY PROTEIN: probable ATP-dependent RNA helicase DDX20 [Drosophila obscura]
MEGSAIAHNLANGEKRTSDVEAGKVQHFSDLHLRREVLGGLTANNFKTPTKIQAAAIPMALTGMDLLVQSKSGTGKTLIYVVAALQTCHPTSRPKPEVLIILPTRELAIQVHDTFHYLARNKMRTLGVNSFIGGTDVTKDRDKLRHCHVVIGTPGRLLQLHEKGVLNTSHVKLLVLDEADQLYMTESLQKTVNALIAVLPLQRQIIACSATFDQNLDEKIAKMMEKPILISNSERATVLLGIRQFVYELPQQVNNMLEMRLKLEALKKIFAQLNYEQAVLFSNSKMRADSYCNYLNAGEIPCMLLSGDLSQQERSEVFEGYRNFSVRTVVATDLIARGVDSHHANLVINLDPPDNHVTYLHRTGRAGRFGSKAIAITFISSPQQSENFKKILAKAGTGMSVLQFPTEGPPSKDFNYFEFDAYQFPYYFKSKANEQDDNELNQIKKPKSTKLAKQIANEKADKVATDVSPVTQEENEVKDKQGDKDPQPQIDVPKVEESAAPQAKEDAINKEALSPAPVEDEKPTNLQFDIITYPPVEETNQPFEVLHIARTSDEILSPNDEKPSTSSAAKKKEKQRRKSEKQKSSKSNLSPLSKPNISPCLRAAQPRASTDNKENRPENGVCSSTDKPLETNQTIMEVEDSPQTSQTPTDVSQEPTQTPTDVSQEPTQLTGSSAGAETTAENPLQSRQRGMEVEESPQTSQTPSDGSQEPTQSTGCSAETHPGPPVNSINTKTYCLAVPGTDNSSTTLQPHVLSNTVDDASSIVSDSLECGYASDGSYVSQYSESDGQIIWQRYRARRQVLKRRRRSLKPRSWYHKCSSFVRLHPAFRSVKRPGIESLLPILAHNEFLMKFENRESIIRRLNDYKKRFKVKNESDWLDELYKTAMEVYSTDYGNATEQDKSEKPQQQQQKPQQPPPALGKLSVHVAHQMDIPAVAAAAPVAAADPDDVADDEATSSESALTSEEGEAFEEMSSPSSGFGESTEESASSGIETSVYDPSGSSDPQDNEDDDDDEDAEDDVDEDSEDDVDEEEEEEEEDALSNVSVAGSSSFSSVTSFEMRHARFKLVRRSSNPSNSSHESSTSDESEGHGVSDVGHNESGTKKAKGTTNDPKAAETKDPDGSDESSASGEAEDSSAPEAEASEHPNFDHMNRAMQLWEETFNRQYQIIANHVVAHMSQYQDIHRPSESQSCNKRDFGGMQPEDQPALNGNT